MNITRNMLKNGIKKNLKRVTVAFRTEEYEKLKKYCDSNNIAVATFIKSRIADIIE